MNNEHLTKPSSRESISSLFREIMDLAGKEQGTGRYFRDGFRLIAEHFSGPYAQLYLRLDTEIVEDYHHSGNSDPGFWESIAQQSITDTLTEGIPKARQFRSRAGSGAEMTIALLSVPVHRRSGGVMGALLVVIEETETSPLNFLLSRLEALVFVLSAYGGKEASEGQVDSGPSEQSLRLLSKAARYESTTELAFSLVNNLSNRTGCDQVILGQVDGQRVHVMAISGHDEVKKQSPETVLIRESMEECLDAGEIVLCQRIAHDDDEHGGQYQIHRIWHEKSKNECVASIPLCRQEENRKESYKAILSLRRHGRQPFSQEELAGIRELTEPYISAFDLIERANRRVFTHVKTALAETVFQCIHPGAWFKKAGIVFLCLVTGWLMFGTANYRIAVPAVVEFDRVCHLAAPYEGVLKSASVVAGDSIREGQILCEFDHDELLMQREKLLAQLRIASTEEDAASSAGHSSQAQLAQARKELYQAELEILNRKIEQSVLRAPFSGTIVRGDLRKQTGGVFPMGTPLYELAPERNWRIELQVPERVAADIVAGDKGRFSCHARPEQVHDVVIRRVFPKTETINGKVIYRAEADVQMDIAWMRAGLEGMARIDAGKRPVWWLVSHRMLDWIRLHVWF